MASSLTPVKNYLRLKTLFIVNPRSGRAQRAIAAVRSFAATHAAHVSLTERPRHATALAARALDDGFALIVAVGGDGTLNEIAAALTGTPATLGLIPCGSGNGLGRHLGIHGTVARALTLLLTGQPRLIDTGLADRHPFFTVAGLGFETEIAARFNRLQRRGFFRYLSTSAAAFHTYEPQSCLIEYDGKRTACRPFTLAVGNSDQYGNNAFIAPDARLDDGLLDLTAIPPVGLLNSLPLLARLFWGNLTGSSAVLNLRASRFVITRPAPGLLHTDGEVHSAPARVEFEIRPASLRVLAPADLKVR